VTAAKAAIWLIVAPDVALSGFWVVLLQGNLI
jgi:hypothetical protein